MSARYAAWRGLLAIFAFTYYGVTILQRPTIVFRSLYLAWNIRPPGGSTPDTLVRIIHACRCEAFETKARLGFSQVRPPEAYVQSVVGARREE